MKALIEEYGVAIFVIAVVIILVAMASPLGDVVKGAITKQINNLENKFGQQ